MKVKLRYILIFVIPAMLLYTMFVTYPLFDSLRLSFYSWRGVGEKTFVGLKNFKELFTGGFSKEVFNALSHNIYFFILVSALELGLGFLIALLIASKIKGAKFYRTVVYIPNMIPLVMVGFMWNLFLHPQIGLVNQFLKAIGLGAFARPWLGDPNLALTTIILVNVWRNLGFYVLVILASILNISPELIEAAYIDGASNWRVTWKIIFPLTVPTFRTLLILLFIGSFNVFDMIYALEGVQAGPFRSTDVLGTVFYRTAFGGLGSAYTDMGLGAAVTVFIFMIVMPMSILYVYLVERREKR
ncbi:MULTISPECIES: carbohydrate ABC transporter permease [Pseudothermotoga]|jgi:raffinose/stachyose/melibiose transport system permease protein|uniref:Binding-protein-dependent transport systems inner membrane component n=1 Tax=Pseudothermotoga lettingae (strain ATCC BAA-301 / DSM 14385 / NBRC 107922 / TMO) TaxID=416591 RepID=A8F488_PSELT|nr:MULTISPECIES: sugar ABC transporter permease [Pseudothermotoga]ABV32972.1 binding-protein-dependent transport systems inner membrane component [Pseudothermotoga lettingae TMO]KUK21983.1 MAG: Binding-protein-dependent transport systems inner membrane component [Pseudothermotoga lettingae]MDI3494248.1 raffinose/stachyose/melibiose transport system permease protein [Pseudothermotoga sp.]MDK2883978.1 raffinose/stachyose/melibiose transport system permease protein [Pseudothermotoga sp.]GLI48026.